MCSQVVLDSWPRERRRWPRWTHGDAEVDRHRVARRMAPPNAPFPTKGEIVSLRCSHVAEREKEIESEIEREKEREKERESE